MQSSLFSTISLYCCCYFYCLLVANFTALLLPFLLYPCLPISLHLSFPITKISNNLTRTNNFTVGNSLNECVRKTKDRGFRRFFHCGINFIKLIHKLQISIITLGRNRVFRNRPRKPMLTKQRQGCGVRSLFD